MPQKLCHKAVILTLVVLMVACGLSGMFILSPEAHAQGIQATLNPTSGPSDTPVAIVGSGWTPGHEICVYWNAVHNDTLTCDTAKQDGTFTDSFTIPQLVAPGLDKIIINDEYDYTFTDTLAINFTVTTTQAPPPAPTPPPPPSPTPVLTTDCAHLVTPWVALYQYANFGGCELCFEGTGLLNLANFGFDKQTMSINIAANGAFFDQPGGQGNQLAFYYADRQADLGAWDNRISSFVVSGGNTPPPAPTPTPTPPPAPTWLYDAGNYAGKSGFVSIAGTYNEPDGSKYFNYCGPGASQELISAWTSNVPSIDMLAKEEKTNQKGPGTYMTDMVKPINDAIGQPYYSASVASSQQDFSNMIGRNILDNGHPLITGIQTQGTKGVPSLVGWSLSAPHIITIYGFDFTSPSVGYIYYYETASPGAGATMGPGKYHLSYSDFWKLVQFNPNADIQLHG